jgi:hypothetical protein
MTTGEYRIVLKVSGGGKYQSKQEAIVEVRTLPYLIFEAPKEGVTISPTSGLGLSVQLFQSGKPLRPQDVFSNHSDQLVIAQVIRSPSGKRGPAIWMESSPQTENSGRFEGVAVTPESREGPYQVAVKIAPEEPEKQAAADATVIHVVMQKPLWLRALTWGLPVLILFALLIWWLRRRYMKSLRFISYVWPEGHNSYEVVSFRKSGEEQELIDLALRMARSGKKKEFRLSPTNDAKLLARAGDKELPFLDVQGEVLVLVQKPQGKPKVVAIGIENPPAKPKPYEPPMEFEAASQSGSGEPAPSGSGGAGEDFDWGFDKK